MTKVISCYSQYSGAWIMRHDTVVECWRTKILVSHWPGSTHAHRPQKRVGQRLNSCKHVSKISNCSLSPRQHRARFQIMERSLDRSAPLLRACSWGSQFFNWYPIILIRLYRFRIFFQNHSSVIHSRATILPIVGGNSTLKSGRLVQSGD